MIRITRGGVRKQEFFNDRTYGGKAKSLKAAKECYAGWAENAPPIQTSRDKKTSRNSTGKVGVHMVRNVDSRWKNAESFGYCASWVTSEGERRKISFAWQRYGKKAAWDLACLARENELADREKIVAMCASKAGKGSKPVKSAVKQISAVKPTKGANPIKGAKPTKVKRPVKSGKTAKPNRASK